MAGDNVYHVPAEFAKETLSAVLRRWLPDKTWNDVKRLIETRLVTVNGNLCMDPARRLTTGEVVKVHERPMPRPPKAADVAVEHCDEEVVVVNKPSGMTTVRHPEERNWPSRRKQVQPTLDELMPRLVQRHLRLPPNAKLERIRAVHRLDRDTSGLLVFGRTEHAERELGKQFRLHTVHRRYLAVVPGRIEAQRIESRLVLNRGDGKRGSTQAPTGGQVAVTHVKPVEFLVGYTLVECRLETGRTHQIRIHLSELGHPVAGDKVYRKPIDAPPIPDHSGAPRLALHAAELGFKHPTSGEHLRFFAPLPLDLATFVERLRKR
jgi:23S rRNA pseudouridine1911/1915/1917 synthase